MTMLVVQRYDEEDSPISLETWVDRPNLLRSTLEGMAPTITPVTPYYQLSLRIVVSTGVVNEKCNFLF